MTDRFRRPLSLVVALIAVTSPLLASAPTVPEPSALIVTALGVGAIVVLARKKRSK